MKKRCPKCKLEKPLADFHKNYRTSLGVDYRCKACKAATTNAISQRRRDARRYAKAAFKVKARDIARRAWGAAEQWQCKVLGCLNQAAELHHVDYEEPLAVVPLCDRHHRGIHD